MHSLKPRIGSANYDNQVSRARMLVDRPDVPLERVATYHELAILRAAALARTGEPIPPIVERETTAAAIEGAIRLGHTGHLMNTAEDSRLAPFAMIGADMAVHDRLRACVMAIVGQLRSNDFAPGRAANLAPEDIDACALDTLIAVLLDCKHINPLH